MLPEWLPWLLQSNDSQFPSGAYAHSMGLEELVQRGAVSNPDELETFLHRQVLPSLLAFEVPFLMAAHACAASGDIEGLRALDEELEAWRLSEELRQASRQIGSRRLSLVQKLDAQPMLATYAASGAPCHHLIVCALELRNAPASVAACAFAWQTIAGYATSAMKLMRLGQERCQSMTHRTMALLAPRLEQAMQTPLMDAGWFNPLIEIASMRHARARERLFIS